MAQYEHDFFELDTNVILDGFGLNERVITELEPADLKGLLSVIAKFAARSRHPDIYGGAVDDTWADVDARTLTAFAKSFNSLTDEGVSEIQEGFSTEALVEVQKDHILELSKTLDETQEKLKTLGDRSFDLLVSPNLDTDVRAVSGFVVSFTNSSEGVDLTLLEIKNGGKVKSAKKITPVEKIWLKNADPWITDLKNELVKRNNRVGVGRIFLAEIGGKMSVYIDGEMKSVDEILPGFEGTIDEPQKAKIPRIYMIAQSVSKKTGIPDKDVLVTYSNKGRSVLIPSDSFVVGFLNRPEFDDYLPKRNATSKLLGSFALEEGQALGEGLKRDTHRMSKKDFWNTIISDPSSFTRSVIKQSDTTPVIVLHSPTSELEEIVSLRSYQFTLKLK